MKLSNIVEGIDVSVSKVATNNNEAAINLHQDISENRYASITSNVYHVNIRKLCKADNQLKPTKQCTGLHFRDGINLKMAVQKLHIKQPDTTAVVLYHHQNQEGW